MRDQKVNYHFLKDNKGKLRLGLKNIEFSSIDHDFLAKTFIYLAKNWNCTFSWSSMRELFTSDWLSQCSWKQLIFVVETLHFRPI